MGVSPCAPSLRGPPRGCPPRPQCLPVAAFPCCRPPPPRFPPQGCPPVVLPSVSPGGGVPLSSHPRGCPPVVVSSGVSPCPPHPRCPLPRGCPPLCPPPRFHPLGCPPAVCVPPLSPRCPPDLRGAVQLVQAQLPGLAGALGVGGGGHGGRGALRGGGCDRRPLPAPFPPPPSPLPAPVPLPDPPLTLSRRRVPPSCRSPTGAAPTDCVTSCWRAVMTSHAAPPRRTFLPPPLPSSTAANRSHGIFPAGAGSQ